MALPFYCCGNSFQLAGSQNRNPRDETPMLSSSNPAAQSLYQLSYSEKASSVECIWSHLSKEWSNYNPSSVANYKHLHHICFPLNIK
jgi:hypothetical protein